MKSKADPLVLLLLLAVLVPILCLIVFPWKPHQIESKHLLGVLPATLCLIAGGSYPISWQKRGFIPILAVIILANNWALHQYWSPTGTKEAWSKTADFLAEYAKENDVIIPAPFYLEYPMSIYAYRRQIPTPIADVYSIIQLEEEPENPSMESIMEAPMAWILELRDSPVSFEDTRTIRYFTVGRLKGNSKEFRGRNGTIVLTPYIRKE